MSADVSVLYYYREAAKRLCYLYAVFAQSLYSLSAVTLQSLRGLVGSLRSLCVVGASNLDVADNLITVFRSSLTCEPMNAPAVFQLPILRGSAERII